jgi:hypothetical protein
MGEEWREFLWQHLLGDLHPMMDIALSHFSSNERVGIIFPEEPHLFSWGENLELATQLASRIGMRVPLPVFFEFPVGTFRLPPPRRGSVSPRLTFPGLVGHIKQKKRTPNCGRRRRAMRGTTRGNVRTEIGTQRPCAILEGALVLPCSARRKGLQEHSGPYRFGLTIQSVVSNKFYTHLL